jgi:hypothetical protein
MGPIPDAGYAVEEVELPSIEGPAQALVVMLSTPGTRGVAASDRALRARRHQRFVSAFFEAAGHPDAVATEQGFITRHAILRSWGEFQETYPRIVAPIATDIPSRGRDRLGRRPGRRRYSRTTSPPHAMFMASSGAAHLRPAIGHSRGEHTAYDAHP